MIVIYLNYRILLVIYITNLYRRKISTFILSKDEILVKKTPTSLHEKKTVCCQWTLILIFCVDVHMGLDPPPPPVHMRPPEPDPLPTPRGRHKWMAPYILPHLNLIPCSPTSGNIPFDKLIHAMCKEEYEQPLKASPRTAMGILATSFS